MQGALQFKLWEGGREPWFLHDVCWCGSSPHDLVACSNWLLVKIICYFILMLLIRILLAFEAFVGISVFWFYGAVSIRRSYLILCLHIFKKHNKSNSSQTLGEHAPLFLNSNLCVLVLRFEKHWLRQLLRVPNSCLPWFKAMEEHLPIMSRLLSPFPWLLLFPLQPTFSSWVLFSRSCSILYGAGSGPVRLMLVAICSRRAKSPRRRPVHSSPQTAKGKQWRRFTSAKCHRQMFQDFSSEIRYGPSIILWKMMLLISDS